MASITGDDYRQNKYRTPITVPNEGPFQGEIDITLKEPPIGQPNFQRKDTVWVAFDDQNINGVVTMVHGPSKYRVKF